MATESDIDYSVDTSMQDNITGKESSLSDWAGDYVTDMLAKGKALGDLEYEAYTGPLTAGESDLQTQAFEGIGSLNIPTENMGAFTAGTATDPGTIAGYMNPYLDNVLNPQINRLKREADIARVADASRLTQAGAYGGSRQSVLDSLTNENLLRQLSDTIGTGYGTAYDKAIGQFNIEQDRGRGVQEDINKYGLAALQKQLDAGAIDRGIETEGVKADKAQFEEEMAFPYKQVQYMQSLLQGLPIGTQSISYAELDPVSQALADSGNVMAFLNQLMSGYNSEG